MNQHIKAQQRHETSSVDPDRLIVSDARDIDEAVKQVGSAQQLLDCFECRLPPANRIVFRASWFGPQGPEKEHVMEADYVLQHTSGVPLSARRLGLPAITDSSDLKAECPTDLPVPVRRVT